MLEGLWRAFRRRKAMSIEPFAAQVSDVPAEEQEHTELSRIFYAGDGPLVHKWRHYLDIYEQHLSPFRTNGGRGPVRLLEIGVSQGGSLHMWRKYFGPDARIFGIDVDTRCSALNGRDAQVRIGSQADAVFLRSVVEEMGGVDIVIDDGSHVARHQETSLLVLLPLLELGGVYICEDLHTAYWPNYGGGYRRHSSMIEIAKALADDIHAAFHDRGSVYPGLSGLVKAIHFYNSIVVIDKGASIAATHVRVGVPSFVGPPVRPPPGTGPR